MIEGLDHIAIAVQDIEQAIQNWSDLTGATLTHREHVIEQNAHVAFLKLGDFHIELIAPDKQDSALGTFLLKRGPGLHHIAIKVSNGQNVLDEISSKGVKLINDTLRQGAEHSKVGFVHPTAFGGVLIEIVEHPKPGVS